MKIYTFTVEVRVPSDVYQSFARDILKQLIDMGIEGSLEENDGVTEIVKSSDFKIIVEEQAEDEEQD